MPTTNLDQAVTIGVPLLLVVLIFYLVKHKKVKIIGVLIGFTLGVALAGTPIGTTIAGGIVGLIVSAINAIAGLFT
ncbi:hypothetical protein [Umezawaea sp. Da 62-37]|uniref:hypothetical protein n=1 Tax=Umezawaea sp. Da 62-37 TaxID=3075927 RepID=UPI0028F6C219|nr:hypothetical protein [Umezawaea sp. Da 62-37]WNV83969.1 hypothetical protein RM788_38270 [Umezawaea sp. Da 62-37]